MEEEQQEGRRRQGLKETDMKKRWRATKCVRRKAERKKGRQRGRSANVTRI